MIDERPGVGRGSSRPALVGRTRELEELRGGVDAALAGRGQLFMLVGEPGIGKTRLADEAASYGAARGARVLSGRCWEGGGAPPDWPWVQIIRAYMDGLDGTAIAAAMGAGAADIAQMIPELHARVPGLRAALTLEPDQARFRLFDSMTLFLKRAAAQQPLIVVLDDLHAADQPSLRLLQFVAREVVQTRIFVIGTYRGAEVRRSPSLASLFAELARDSRRISLSGLTAADVGTLIEDTWQQAVPASTVAIVHQVTDGNPFFVDEVARLFQADSGWNERLLAGGTVHIPDTVRQVIRRRLEPLSADTQRILTVASVIGREFDVNVLSQVVRELASPLVDALEEAVAAGVVREMVTSVGRYAFLHALIRETLRHDLPPLRRMQLHGEVGDVLERLFAERADCNFAELAHHFFQAAAVGGADKAIAYAQRAGAQALTHLAYEEATNHYTRALEALRFLDPDEGRRCELLLALGEAQRRAGENAAASATFHRAAALARQLGAAPQLARAALGFGRGGETGEINDALVTLLEDALAQLPPADDRLRALLLARLAMALYFSPAHERRAVLSDTAVAIARRLDDASTLVATLIARHFALWGPASVQERLVIADEITRVGAAAGEQEMVMEGRLWQLIDLLEIGDGLRFDREWDRFARAATALRLPIYRWHVEMIRAMRALSEGRLDASEEASNAALAIGQQARIARAPQFFGVQLFYLRRRQRRLGELEASVRSFADQYPALPIWRSGLALLYTELGRSADARRELARVAANDYRNLPHDGNWLPAMAMVAEACVAAEMTNHAERLYELLLPHAAQNVVITEAIACLGPVAYFLGLLAASLRRWSDAARHFDAALEMNRRLGATLLVAETQYAYARMLIGRDDGGERERGAVLFAEARAGYAALGMNLEMPAGWEPATRGSAAPERAASPPVDAPESIFRRDGDFWTIAHDGTVLRLRDSRGLFYPNYLLRHPNREFYAHDLVRAAQGGDEPVRAHVAGAPAELQKRAHAESDAGPILDQQAKAAYRQRLRELKDDFEQAQEFNDLGRLERARQEIDLITHELSAAVGLGGRDRKASSDAERARIAVTKAITLALRSIADGNLVLRRYLGNTIKTGRFCSYAPDLQNPVSWVL